MTRGSAKSGLTISGHIIWNVGKILPHFFQPFVTFPVNYKHSYIQGNWYSEYKENNSRKRFKLETGQQGWHSSWSPALNEITKCGYKGETAETPVSDTTGAEEELAERRSSWKQSYNQKEKEWKRQNDYLETKKRKSRCQHSNATK